MCAEYHTAVEEQPRGQGHVEEKGGPCCSGGALVSWSIVTDPARNEMIVRMESEERQYCVGIGLSSPGSTTWPTEEDHPRSMLGGRDIENLAD